MMFICHGKCITGPYPLRLCDQTLGLIVHFVCASSCSDTSILGSQRGPHVQATCMVFVDWLYVWPPPHGEFCLPAPMLPVLFFSFSVFAPQHGGSARLVNTALRGATGFQALSALDATSTG